MVRRSRTVGLALVAAALLAGCDRPSSRPRPNVVLVSIDTLRPDRLAAYGHSRPTSPTLDRLARTGVRFANAYSTSSWTVPAIASLLTSALPIRHGVVHGVVRQGSLVGQEVVPADLPSLPETLQRHGYQTFGVAANVHLEGEFGFARGFDHYRCVGFADAEPVFETVRSWKTQRAAGRPYFAWVHFFDPHEPYIPRQPWMAEFLAGRPAHPDLDSRRGARTYERMELDGERLEYVKTLYDSEIRHTDAFVERTLAELGVTTDDLVIVLSDHGEEFGEHGIFGHGSSLHEASVRIPLIVRLPQEELAGLVVDERVSILDVFPTIAALLQAPMPAEIDGRSLLDGMRRPPLGPQPIFLQISRRKTHLDAFILEDWKLVSPVGDAGPARLFHLRDDPGERVDRAATEVATTDRLRAMLREHASQHRTTRLPQAGKALDAAQVEALKAMGYLQ